MRGDQERMSGMGRESGRQARASNASNASNASRWQGNAPSRLRKLPVIGVFAREWAVWQGDRRKPRFSLEPPTLGSSDEPAYPVNMTPLLDLPHGRLDENGVPFNTRNGAFGVPAYQPTSVAQYGLAQWNAYLRDRQPQRLDAFMTQARWLATHATRLTTGAVVWPIPFPSPPYGAMGPWLSALTQGNVVCVLVRAYRLTGDEQYLTLARAGVEAFKLDVLDGGVQTPVAADGLFFEEVATYPASRILNGFIISLFGLYDYVDLTGDADVQALINRSVATLHTILAGYDAGFWSRYDLLHKRLASRFYHSLHIILLRALARRTGCEHCLALAARWEAYERSPLCRARYYLATRAQRYRAELARRRGVKPAQEPDGRRRVGLPITAFPVIGGMRSVLFGAELVMADEWQMEYLTRRIGPEPGERMITSFEVPFRPFGPETTAPTQFPNVLFYRWAGARKLARLARQRRFGLLLPQDGVFTAAFTVPVARRLGIPVVTMDHGTVTLPFDERYQAQRQRHINHQPWPKRLLSRARYALYRRVARRMLWTAAQRGDRFLVAGDEVQEVYEKFCGVLPDRIIRYPFRVDTTPFMDVDPAEVARLRAELGVPADALVVLLINRLAPEKGLEYAIEGIAQSCARLPEDERARLRVIIAGSGELRAEVEAQIARSGLSEVCALYGEAQREETQRLLTIGDIFVYSGTRGTNFSMAVLEAMAAGCSVIATTEPISNARLLADGRGFAIPAGQAAPIADALTILLTQHERRRQMGRDAQAYMAREHSAEAMRRGLHRATGFAPDLAALTIAPTNAGNDENTGNAGNAGASVATDAAQTDEPTGATTSAAAALMARDARAHRSYRTW